MDIKYGSGILLPIFSLPSPYGIGTMGKAAYEFLDFLKLSGQKYWQILPLNPVNFSNSPYQSYCVFAGNPLFIDIDLLTEKGLLLKNELPYCKSHGSIDYEAVKAEKLPLLKKACARGYCAESQSIKEFAEKNSFWIYDYSLFMALKSHFKMLPFFEWPKDIKTRQKNSVDFYKELLKEEIKFHIYTQYLFFEQYTLLKKHAESLDIKIIGDLPIYTALDSSDFWANPKNYLTDGKNSPAFISGVPPDCFSNTGQLWGNPIYDWEKMKKDNFSWWMKRIKSAADMYDIIRIDHFRGLSSYWSIPYGKTSAACGKWEKGPGILFINEIKKNFKDVCFIAENLGILSEDVNELLKKSRFLGMKVLEYAFDPKGTSPYLPHKYPPDCVCYPATHDNNTLLGWEKDAPRDEIEFAAKYLGIKKEESLSEAIICSGLASKAKIFICQLQDYMGLGSEGRINIPGTATGNWVFRLSSDSLSLSLAQKIRGFTEKYGRI